MPVWEFLQNSQHADMQPILCITFSFSLSYIFSRRIVLLLTKHQNFWESTKPTRTKQLQEERKKWQQYTLLHLRQDKTSKKRKSPERISRPTFNVQFLFH